MTYSDWLHDIGALKRESESARAANRLRPKGRGRQVYLGPWGDVGEEIEAKGAALLEQLHENAPRWRPELAALASGATREYLNDIAPPFVHGRILEVLVRQHSLCAGAIDYAMYLAFEPRGDIDVLPPFLDQLPFGDWPLEEVALDNAWQEFLDRYFGEHYDGFLSLEPVFTSLELAKRYLNQGKPLHAISIYEFCLQSNEEELWEQFPEVWVYYHEALRILYGDVGRHEEANTHLAILDRKAANGEIEWDLYGRLELQLAALEEESRMPELYEQAEVDLQRQMPGVWDRLDYIVQRILIEAKVLSQTSFRRSARNIAIAYWGAIERQWIRDFRDWERRAKRHRAKRPDGTRYERLRNEQIAWEIIPRSNEPTPEAVRAFLATRWDPDFLRCSRTQSLLNDLKRLRNSCAHQGPVDRHEVEQTILRLRQDDFLTKYFEALAPR